MMQTQMNDFDFEEKNLLSSLHHHHIEHQPLILPGPNEYFNEYQQNNHQYVDDRKHHRRPHNNNSNYTQAPHHHRMVSAFDNENLATTVSMSTEEDLLDNFELNFESEQPNIVDNNNNNNNNTNGVNTDIVEATDTVTIVSAKSTIPNKVDEPFLVTPELPRNITMETKPKQNRRKQQQQSRKSSPSRKKKEEAKPTTIVRVGVPTPEDILCGQSRVCANHPGNRTFQSVLADFAHRYDIATSKQEKMQMTKAIVSIIHDSGGRFLKYKDGMWEEISTVAARDKVSHALRTKVSSWRRQNQQLLQKEKGPFSRQSMARQSRKRSIRDSASPIPLERQESSKFNDLLQSQQTNFANLTTPPPTSRHRVRHSYGGDEFYHNVSNHSQHSRRSNSSF
jgi:hypothetical protein